MEKYDAERKEAERKRGMEEKSMGKREETWEVRNELEKGCSKDEEMER